MLQFRPIGNPSEVPFYNPERDLAHVGPLLIREAIAQLEPSAREFWFNDYLTKNNVSDAQLAVAAERIAKALSDMTTDARIALGHAGFFDLPIEVQIAVYTKIGQVFLAATHTAIRWTLDESVTKAPIADRIQDAAQTISSTIKIE